MNKEMQTPLMDALLRLMPELRDHLPLKDNGKKPKASPSAANRLYSLWQVESNKVGSRRFRRPNTISSADIDLLQKEGLIVVAGEHVDFTSRGEEIIKQMILGDDRSAFDSEKPVNYLTALANLKPSRQRKTGKISCACEKQQRSNWYQKAQSPIEEA